MVQLETISVLLNAEETLHDLQEVNHFVTLFPLLKQYIQH